MKLNPAQEYELTLKNDLSYELKANNIVCKFSSPASKKNLAKLYTVTENKVLLYIGITSQSMSSRLNSGLKSKGKNGYHGYKWKGIRSGLTLRIWTIQEKELYISHSDVEAIEAEVAFLCRHLSKNWPKYQNEIHFQASSKEHKKIAKKLYKGAIS